uniref:C-type lectin domain-containing protein n=1 Tax=Acrobeloides nanus TaxID=290746 RepID=A0A914DU24_9BILA
MEIVGVVEFVLLEICVAKHMQVCVQKACTTFLNALTTYARLAILVLAAHLVLIVVEINNLCPKSLYYISECINNLCPVGYTCFGSPPSAYCCGNQQPITCSSIDSNGQQCATNSNCADGFLCDVLNQRCCANLGVTPTPQGPCLSGGVCPTGQFCLQSDQNCYILYTTRVVPVSSTLTTTITATATTTTATTTTTQASSITCDSGWTYFQDTMSCYKVLMIMIYIPAEADCVSQGGHLASVHSQAEDDFLIALSKSGFVYPTGLNLDTQVFVGGIDSNLMDGVCSYMWTDGTPFDYMNFHPTEPNNCDGEGCLEIMTDNHVDKTDIAGLWNNIACDLVMRAYICKKAVNS